MRRGLVVVDWLVALALTAFGVWLVSGADKSNPKHTGAAAAVAVMTMTLPVAWRRRAPIAVAVVLGVGGVLNPVVIGTMIRCGPALPALLLGAYGVGRFPAQRDRRREGAGLAFLLASAVSQCLTDPRLGPPVLVVMVPLILGLYAVGQLVTSRVEVAAELERRNAELAAHRTRRAEIAVEVERERIARGLDEGLSAQIEEIGAAAMSGRSALVDDASPEAVQAAFSAISRRGRDTLGNMRRVVGALLEREPAAPQPSLSQLDLLLERAGAGDVHLHVTGKPRVLPTGVELSAYRSLEHLLDAYGGDSGRRIDIDVDFAAEALVMSVRGPAPSASEMNGALASVRARVELHHGSLMSSCPDGMWVINMRLPVEANA
jgi:signal transduction histidine kinase